MKRIVILVSVLLTFLASAAWAQTVTGGATTEDVAQNVVRQEAPCGTGCLCSPAGLIGWWAGDENAKDIQGAGIPCLKSPHVPSNGILMNGARFARGFVREAFSLDGIDDYVDVPDTLVLHTVTTAVTVEAWINPQRPFPLDGYGEGWVLARRDPNVSEGFGLWINSDGFMYGPFQADLPGGVASTDPVIVYDSKWKHVALTVDTLAGRAAVYLNGHPVAEIQDHVQISGNLANVSHLYLGRREDASVGGEFWAKYYRGLIDEVGLYNRALTPTEIQAIYSVGRGGRCKNLFEPGPLSGGDGVR
jgi:hypothetical protein